ncbi:MAG: hypothetical protein R3C19_07765 [Planctomycetaceae bacterium]
MVKLENPVCGRSVECGVDRRQPYFRGSFLSMYVDGLNGQRRHSPAHVYARKQLAR